MSESLPPRLRQSLAMRARKIGAHLGCEVRTSYDHEAAGGPTFRLDVQDGAGHIVSVVYLAASNETKGYRYTVGTPGESPPHPRFTSDSDAVRAFQVEALATGKARGLHRPQRVATTEPKAAYTSMKPRGVLTPSEAVRHPVIRAAVIAGHEAAKGIGDAPDPGVMLMMADAALDVVEARAPGSTTNPADSSKVERVLIGLLAGALVAGEGAA